MATILYWMIALLAISAIHQDRLIVHAKLQAISPAFHTLTVQATQRSQVTLCENQLWQSPCHTKTILDDAKPILFKGKEIH